MIKCMECGKEVNRIQWTHLKYKCTGRFNNCEEYVTAFPEAKLVDSELAKRTSLTYENMIKKYGATEGENRWSIYRQKQAISNSYEYKKEKHGWTKKQFDEYNSSRAVTLEKCIERHGEKNGLIVWNEYCEKQAYTNTKEYFLKKYGEDLGLEKYIQYNKQKGLSNSPTYIADKLNISLDKAVEILLSKFNTTIHFASKIEEEFTKLLESKIGKLEHTSLNKPFGKWSKELKSYVIYDIKHKDAIIEFNGDYWHCNPKLFEETDIAHGNKTALDIWKRDEIKIKTAIEGGFRVLIVWESEFRKNKQETIERVIKWMQNGQK